MDNKADLVVFNANEWSRVTGRLPGLADLISFVRIPKGHFLAANLPKLYIILHQMQDAPDRLTSLAPLQTQPGVKTVEAGRLAGVQLERLPATLRTQFQQILGETETLK